MFRKINDAVSPLLTLTVDGQAVTAEIGETVAAVLLRQPMSASRTTPVSGSPRAPFCMMGVCFDCLAIVDGASSTQSCLITVREGMRVERQYGRRSLAS
ncbi:(2Fe-2S)-binding protein [Variovorax davisae]|uniref:(2Fe-2S)-binding protein n=1 Tax=Variovorax davisae TaxID=3053515 RepID=UPI002577BCA4|nr:(2Fe-2S)-binding protein [Variovorax sp. J22P271]